MVSDETENDWRWDATLYAGSAAHYARGRMAYPQVLIDTIVQALQLDGRQRLLDLGCGPGAVVVPLSIHVREAIGLDPDQSMLDEAQRFAGRQNVTNTGFVCSRAEDLAENLGNFDVVTAAQSFHWMDQPLVASTLRKRINEGGAFVHVGAVTHKGVETDEELSLPQPPHKEVEALIAAYLGPIRRAGQGTLPGGTKSGENQVLPACGFSGPEVHDIGGDEVVQRSVDEVVSAVLSLSYAAPHLFGDRLQAFESDLRALLDAASFEGQFNEKTGDIRVSIWR